MWHHSGSESCHLDLHPQIHCCASIGSCACRRRRRLFVVSLVPHEQILYLFAFASFFLAFAPCAALQQSQHWFFTCGPPCLFLSPSRDHPSLSLSLSFLIPRHHTRRLDGSAFGELRYCCEGELCMRRFSDGLTTAGNKSRQHRSGFSACFSSSSSPAEDFVFSVLH